MLAEFHFLRPLWFFALLPFGLLIYALFRRHLQRSHWEGVCDRALLPHILSITPGKRRRYTMTWLAICGTILIIALAGPTWERIPQTVLRGGNALVIVLDLSRSMDSNDIRPSRLEQARYKIADLLKLRREGQTALVVYAADAFTVTPLTDDVDTITLQLSALSSAVLPSQGSQTGRALTHASTLLAQAGHLSGHILLVSDGIAGENSQSVLSTLKGQGYLVSVLAVGTEQGAPIQLAEGGLLKDKRGRIVIPATDHAELRQAAKRGGGQYAMLQIDNSDIQGLQAFFGQANRLARLSETRLKTDQWRERGAYLLLLVLPFAALAFRRGYLLWLVCLIMPLSRPASALEWDALWLNADQRGGRQFEAGHYTDARQSFQDPAWQAAAAYRAGQYAEAAALLEQETSPEGLYNLGNALAKQGLYAQAIAAYERALALEPDNQYAQENLALVRQRLQDPQGLQQGTGDGQAGSQGTETAAGGQQPDRSPPDPQGLQQGTGDGQAGSQGTETTAGGQQPDQTHPGSMGQAEGRADQSSTTDQGSAASGRDSTDQALSQSGLDERGLHEADRISERAEAGHASASHEPETEDAADLLTQQDGPSPDGSPPDESPPVQSRSPLMSSHALSTDEQLLRRIPDDPGELFKRKFYYQYEQRRRQHDRHAPGQDW